MKQQRFKEKLFDKYHLIIRNEQTYSERFNLKLSPFNIMAAIATMVVIIFFFAFTMVKFTPIKYYLMSSSVGNSVQENFHSVVNLKKVNKSIDSISRQLKANVIYANNLRAIMSGKVPKEKLNNSNLKESPVYDIKDEDFMPSKADIELREEVENENKFNVNIKSKSEKNNFFLLAPVKGIITTKYNIEEHPAIDIAADLNSSIKAISDGVVTFTGWTAEFGHIIIINHPENMISVYKHNATILKETGDIVKKGQAIATVGNSGELSSGPHLHFELWLNNYLVDAEKYIKF